MLEDGEVHVFMWFYLGYWCHWSHCSSVLLRQMMLVDVSSPGMLVLFLGWSWGNRQQHGIFSKGTAIAFFRKIAKNYRKFDFQVTVGQHCIHENRRNNKTTKHTLHLQAITVQQSLHEIPLHCHKIAVTRRGKRTAIETKKIPATAISRRVGAICHMSHCTALFFSLKNVK